jgi:hypothetical protein
LRNIWKVLKFGAGEGWRSIVRICEKIITYRDKEERNILGKIRQRKA